MSTLVEGEHIPLQMTAKNHPIVLRVIKSHGGPVISSFSKKQYEAFVTEVQSQQAFVWETVENTDVESR